MPSVYWSIKKPTKRDRYHFIDLWVDNWYRDEALYYATDEEAVAWANAELRRMYREWWYEWQKRNRRRLKEIPQPPVITSVDHQNPEPSPDERPEHGKLQLVRVWSVNPYEDWKDEELGPP